MDSYQRQRYKKLLSLQATCLQSVVGEVEVSKDSYSTEPTCKVDAILNKASSNNQSNPGSLKKSLPSSCPDLKSANSATVVLNLKPKRRGRTIKSPGIDHDELPTKRTKLCAGARSPRVTSEVTNSTEVEKDISALSKTMQVIEKERRRLKFLGYDCHYYSTLSSKQLSERFILLKQTINTQGLYEDNKRSPSPSSPIPQDPLNTDPINTLDQSNTLPSPNASQTSSMNVDKLVSPKRKVLLSRKLQSPVLSSPSIRPTTSANTNSTITTDPPSTSIDKTISTTFSSIPNTIPLKVSENTTTTTSQRTLEPKEIEKEKDLEQGKVEETKVLPDMTPKEEEIQPTIMMDMDMDDVWFESIATTTNQSPSLEAPIAPAPVINNSTSTNKTQQSPNKPIDIDLIEEEEDDEKEIEILDPFTQTVVIDLTFDDDDDADYHPENSMDISNVNNNNYVDISSSPQSLEEIKIEENKVVKGTRVVVEQKGISGSSSSNIFIEESDDSSVHSVANESTESTDHDENERFKKQIQAVKEMSMKEYELLQKKQAKSNAVVATQQTTTTVHASASTAVINLVTSKGGGHQESTESDKRGTRKSDDVVLIDSDEDTDAWDWLEKVSGEQVTSVSSPTAAASSTSSSSQQQHPSITSQEAGITIHRLKCKEYVRTVQGNNIHDPISIPYSIQPVLCYNREEILELYTNPIHSYTAYFTELQLKKQEMIYLLQCSSSFFNRYAQGCIVKYIPSSSSSSTRSTSSSSSKYSSTANKGTTPAALAIGIIDTRSISAYERITQQPQTLTAALRANTNNQHQQHSSRPGIKATTTGYNSFLIDLPPSAATTTTTAVPEQPAAGRQEMTTTTTIDPRIIHVDKVSDVVMMVDEWREYVECLHPEARRRYTDAYLQQKIQHIRYFRRLISTKFQ